MNNVELSDLEEGEILEYDSYSPVESSDDFEIKNRSLGFVRKENTNCHFELKDRRGKNLCGAQQRRYGNGTKNLKGKVEPNGKLGRPRVATIDLESISSEGEYKSDGEEKYVVGQKEQVFSNGDARGKGKHSSHFYGTVEDIMSEIGETICRKSRCNYKKRKSKEFVKYSDNSYDLWRDKVFSSHLKEKKRKRKVSESDSESVFGQGRVEKRKRRKKKREGYYEEGGVGKRKPKARDFDEMRRNLLEKLEKQKAEEALKALRNSSPPEEGNSEIQEVDMLVDCTNYVDDPPGSVEGKAVNGEGEGQEKEGDEELDLIKLRLIALASNKKGKSGGSQSKTEAREGAAESGTECAAESAAECAAESAAEERKAVESNSKGEGDLDRNELLLRAEALKTALLKKHQKRLNKLKMEKSKAVGSSSDNDLKDSSSSGQERRVGEMASGGEGCAEKGEESTKESGDKSPNVLPCHVADVVNQKEPLVPSANLRRGNARGRNKRKKRKSFSLANSLKENSDKGEALEEDDRTLRSQLLSDLMRKKSLKDSERKPVLTDSVQGSVNQMPVVRECPEGNGKPAAVRKNPLKKVNVAKAPKPVAVAKVPVPEIQRIIVHLGSEDSSDENGSHEEKPSAAERESEVQESVKAEPEKVQENVQANYEKSVELLLSQARMRIEGKLQTPKSTALTTPEAVYKHLPPSQRLEYLRLKQKIAERERLRKQKNESSGPRRPDATPPAAPGASDPQRPEAQGKSGTSPPGGSPVALKVAGEPKCANGAVTRAGAPRSVGKVKSNLVGVEGKGWRRCPTAGGVSSSLLLPSSQALITKLKLLLKKIKIEKTIEENYEKEISKLKNQLNLFERRKTEQRFKIKKLGEESMKTYRAIQGITGRGSEASAKEESGVEEKRAADEGGGGGSKEEGEQSQEGKKVPIEPEKEITESEIDKELNSGGDGGGAGEPVSSGASSALGLLQYSSPLEAFKKASDASERVDPNAIMCQFDLMGVCKDEECTYQHLRKS